MIEKELTEKLDRMKVDLKDALTEIETRGHAIASLEGLSRGLADLVAQILFPSPEVLAPPVEENKKKAKRLLIQARTLGCF